MHAKGLLKCNSQPDVLIDPFSSTIQHWKKNYRLGYDVLYITSDHGNDPTTPSTDHSREYVPLLVYGESLAKNRNLGTRDTFADLGQTIAEFMELRLPVGHSFKDKISHIP